MLTDRPVVVYDGSCGFCRRWILRLKRWDRHDRIDLLPLQDEAAVRLTGRPIDELVRAAHVVLPDGGVFAGARAFHEICRYLPGGRVVRAFFAIPGVLSLAERAYRRIAHRWGPVGALPRGD